MVLAMSRIVWQEVIYRCDGEFCNDSDNVYCHMEERNIQKKPRIADRQIKLEGWLIKRDGTCYCPDCAKKLRSAKSNA
jgi:hypothetical protein